MTNTEKIRVWKQHCKRVSELFLAKYPNAKDFKKTDPHFLNKCREVSAKELNLITL